MRGAHKGDTLTIVGFGIIPADAGSTTCTATWPHAARDHPRGCGEHDYGRRVVGSQAGSSPRMRGALSTSSKTWSMEGIIPADAGSTITDITC